MPGFGRSVGGGRSGGPRHRPPTSADILGAGIADGEEESGVTATERDGSVCKQVSTDLGD